MTSTRTIAKVDRQFDAWERVATYIYYVLKLNKGTFNVAANKTKGPNTSNKNYIWMHQRR